MVTEQEKERYERRSEDGQFVVAFSCELQANPMWLVGRFRNNTQDDTVTIDPTRLVLTTSDGRQHVVVRRQLENGRMVERPNFVPEVRGPGDGVRLDLFFDQAFCSYSDPNVTVDVDGAVSWASGTARPVGPVYVEMRRRYTDDSRSWRPRRRR